MKLHFLGTTGYHPNNTRQTACLMIPEVGMILDAGTGMFRTRELIQTKTLRIFLSHVHLDHCIGITFLFDVLAGKDIDRVIVYCESEKIETLKQHLFAKLLFPVMPDFEFVAFDRDPIECGQVMLSTIPLKHPGGSLGFRIENGDKKMAYITDTTASSNAGYIEEIKNVDLLVHECYFPDGEEARAELTGHSCLSPVCEVAKKSGAKRLMLVHINPMDENAACLDLDAGRKIFPNLSVAEDHQVVDW